MENSREYWKQVWNEHARSDNMFVQIGRSSYTPLEFFIMVKDICEPLNLDKNDLLLDAGGGTGWVSIAVSPFVKQVVLFDYAQEMVKKASELTQCFNNIEVCHDDLLELKNIKQTEYDKIIVSSVLQYFQNYDEIEIVFSNLYKFMKKGGIAILTHNPDIEKKEAHIKSYDRLSWEPERIKNAIDNEYKRFWIDKDKLMEIAKRTGFSQSYETPINPKLWQSTHMFDLVIRK